MKDTTGSCGCCAGMEKRTPLPTANRPGLTRLLYRIGAHATFFETMLTRLSTLCLGGDEECRQGEGRYPLHALRTRDRSDPSIALLDAWATVADVLTFYQERIANEGFLCTATERRSVLELARLVGYQLRPGVSSSVFLAYTLDENCREEVVISKGTRAQSVPGPGELSQSFETGEDLRARARWNNLKPRTTRPQSRTTIETGDTVNQHVYLKGISTNLKPNDPLLIAFDDGEPEFYHVKEVQPNAPADRTLVILQEKARTSTRAVAGVTADHSETRALVEALTLRPSVQPRNASRLSRGLQEQFSDTGEAAYGAAGAFAPVLRETLATAVANQPAKEKNTVQVYALRVTASVFGSTAPRKPERLHAGTKVLITREWELSDIEESEEITTENDQIICPTVFLDAGYRGVLPGSWIVMDMSAVARGGNDGRRVERAGETVVAKVRNVKADTARAAYGISGKTTRIDLVDIGNRGQPWFTIVGDHTDEAARKQADDFQIVRRTVVYAQSEELELAEEPVRTPLCRGGAALPIELDGFYDGLESGRWVIVAGEREIAGTEGVKSSELAMIGAVEHGYERDLAGDRRHTFITLANELKYCFRRDTVTIYGNVVKATHGETRSEVLGSGDGAAALQAFPLKQPPLTFVSAPSPSGAESTLVVYVNDVRWQETESFTGLAPTARRFITSTDNEGKTVVTFGNGREGARLPTGLENVRAEYRNGIGRPGNVKAGQITLLATRPLGVKEVINPLRASGGADQETRDQARRNVPLAVTALDRLVSVQDYEDFARTYAGVGKARAVEISDGGRQLVHVTIAGAEDIPIDQNSDLYQNLRQALLAFGDPYQAIQLEIRELMLIVVSARIRILPDYPWESVEPKIRAAMLEAFGFARRELGQDVLLSEVISVMQAVRGVSYVDVDVLGGVPEKKVDAGERRLLTPKEIANAVQDLIAASRKTGRPEPRVSVNLTDHKAGTIRPAQLAFLPPDVPATLILNQIT